MKEKVTKVWYASYGSNMLESRFSCYIAGGTPVGAQRTYVGCTNRSLPALSKPIIINAELYFARKSKTWHGGGVGFIRPSLDPAITCLGRMYLITADQFAEVVKQEIRLEENLIINMDELIRKGFLILDDRSWYNKLLFLGYEDGYPVLTFTNKDYLKDEINAPNKHYLRVIISGLRETYNTEDSEIRDYLENIKGVKETGVGLELEEILKGYRF